MPGTTWSSLHPDTAVLIGRKWFKEPGDYNYTVPASAKFVRAFAQGCGGQGQFWGGGGALAKCTVPVTAGDNLKVHVGDVSTSSTPGDSSVKRNDNSVICYADRGRGSGARGLASNSIGDVVRDGSDGGGGSTDHGGAPASDAADYGNMGFGGRAITGASLIASDYGGGGHTFIDTDENGILHNFAAWGAGTGLVVLEFFDSNPGY
jgi:hypothetical protein